MPWKRPWNPTKHHVRQRGAVNMEYVFAGALAAIILGSLALTIHFGLSKDDVGDLPEQHWQCEKCGEVFVGDLMTPEEMARKMGPGGLLPIDCPKCGAKDSVYQTIQCPQCGEWYIPATAKFPEAQITGQDIRNICPKCGTDYRQWFIEHRGQRQ